MQLFGSFTQSTLQRYLRAYIVVPWCTVYDKRGRFVTYSARVSISHVHCVALLDAHTRQNNATIKPRFSHPRSSTHESEAKAHVLMNSCCGASCDGKSSALQMRHTAIRQPYPITCLGQWHVSWRDVPIGHALHHVNANMQAGWNTQNTQCNTMQLQPNQSKRGHRTFAMSSSP